MSGPDLPPFVAALRRRSARPLNLLDAAVLADLAARGCMVGQAWLRNIERSPGALDEAKVEALMSSIASDGLREAIVLREVPPSATGFGHMALVDGVHRLEALQRLGGDCIECVILETAK
ncbi:MAG: ParB N-terminal domain-containing protein [Bradyrhizobium sp.]|uniref:ParB N-terminal domain-containing protein n=1 Tax=Bradyrhizobium sp. TaxID=376 RepID=UPI003D0E9A26